MEASSVNLLSMKTHPNENNNMLETQKFELCDCEKTMKLEKPGIITKERTRVLFIVAVILIGFAILSLVTAVILVVKFSGRGEEKISSQNQTSHTTISPTPSSSIPVLSTSTSSPSISTSSTLHPTKSTMVSTTTVTMETSTYKPTSTVISTTVTKPTTSATTPETVCESNEFRCSDGTCIVNSYVCDGKPHCPLAEDEHKDCECSATQFRCHSGQCVAANSRCDGVPQCYDKSDEMNCSNCRGFQCTSGQCLWSNSVRCNNHVDCLDLSDELNCDMRRGYNRCKNGLLVHRSKLCDGVDDCFDNSDEADCGKQCNLLAERMCKDGSMCVMREWFCDGHVDCSDGSDEKDCGTCGSNESQCTDYSCIQAQQVCDGIKQCSAGEDEVDCLKFIGNGISSTPAGIVTVKSQENFLPICSDIWASKVADEICQYFGYRRSSGTSYIPETAASVTVSQGFVMLKDKQIEISTNQSLLSKFIKLPMCPGRKIISVQCQPNVCGERKVDILTPFIVGGTLSPKGKWPWVVSVSMLGKGVCGGVIINQRWILTSAHCVVTASANYTLTPHFFEITAGSTNRKREVGDHSQRRNVNKIVLHPQMRRFVTGLTEWDLALFRVDFPLFYGDYIQPICLPDLDETFPTNSHCYLAGWGFINTQEVTVNSLREGKMRLWGEQDCADNGISSPLNTNATICAGYYSGAISACKGDSGSPLMCSDNRGRWTVAGVMSHGVNGCDGGSQRRANRYARVSTAVGWIQKTTGS